MKAHSLFRSTVGTLLPAFLVAAACAAPCLPRAAADTAYAAQVIDYTPGTGLAGGYNNSAAALGKPGNATGGVALSPFSPNYGGTQLTGVGLGGQLTLALSNFVAVGPAGTLEIGLFGNASLNNAGTGPNGSPGAGSPAQAFGVRSVQISVSADGLVYVPLNGGGLITSTLPANYYTNIDTSSTSSPPPANPQLADFGQPFTGTLASFNGQSYSQILSTLGGSAGGTWLDLSGTGLSQVGFIRFTEPAVAVQNGGIFYLDGVSINGSLIGAAVPEPGTAALLALAFAGGAVMLALGRRSKLAVCAAAMAGCAALPATGHAQLIGSLTEGPDSAPYSYYLTIQFANGHYYDFTLRTATASYSGTDFINTVSAGSQGTSLVLNLDQEYANGLGYYLNGVTANGDASSGFANNSYWTYWTGSATNPVAWTYSQVGEDSRTITPGQADGWVYGDGSVAPSATAFAVPEPSTWALMSLVLVGGGVWTYRRRAGFPRMS